MVSAAWPMGESCDEADSRGKADNTKDVDMHVVVRHYKGSAKLIDELADRSEDVEKLIREVEGFIAYYLVKTNDGGVSVSVFENEAGAAESTRRAGAYLKENLDGVAVGPPEVIEGQTVIDFR